MRFVSFGALALAALVVSACGENKTTVSAVNTVDGQVVSAGSVEITSPALRAPLGNNTNTAAYFTVINKGAEEDRLVSAACECAETTEIHTMRHENGVMKMEALPDGLPIKAGETVTLAPGGHHIMMLGLTKRPENGTVQPVTLTFEKAGSVVVNFPVVQQINPETSHNH